MEKEISRNETTRKYLFKSIIYNHKIFINIRETGHRTSQIGTIECILLFEPIKRVLTSSSRSSCWSSRARSRLWRVCLSCLGCTTKQLVQNSGRRWRVIGVSRELLLLKEIATSLQDLENEHLHLIGRLDLSVQPRFGRFARPFQLVC